MPTRTLGPERGWIVRFFTLVGEENEVLFIRCGNLSLADVF